MGGRLRQFFSSLSGTFGCIVLLAACSGAILAPWLAVQDPYNLASLNVIDSLLAPGSRGVAGHVYHLGTDEQGRDIYSALLYGLRISLGVAAIATLIAC